MNEAELLRQLKNEEKILAARLDAVRRTIAVFNGNAPPTEEDDEAFMKDVEAAGDGNISRAIRTIVRNAGKEIDVPSIVANVKAAYPAAKTGSIKTLVASLCRTGELKRVSKGVYRLAK